MPYTYYEVRADNFTCGHHHKTKESAQKCCDRLTAQVAKYGWQMEPFAIDPRGWVSNEPGTPLVGPSGKPLRRQLTKLYVNRYLMVMRKCDKEVEWLNWGPDCPSLKDPDGDAYVSGYNNAICCMLNADKKSIVSEYNRTYRDLKDCPAGDVHRAYYLGHLQAYKDMWGY